MKLKILLLFFVILFSLSQVSATLTLDIDMASQFKTGEQISFAYKISSDNDGQINYIANVYCPNAPLSLLEMKEIYLEANVLFEEEYIYLDIQEDIESQTCEASISIIDVDTLDVIFSKEKKFEILAKDTFDFRIVLDKKVYIQGEKIDIGYSSNSNNLLIVAKLSLPNGQSKEIDLPYSFEAEQIGTYNLETIASAEAHKEIEIFEQFGVIEGEADFEYVSLVADNKEGQSELTLNQPNLDKTSAFYITLVLIVMTVIVVFILFLSNRKKKKQ